MKRLVCYGLLIIIVSLVGPSAPAQTPQRRNAGRDAWHEFLVKQFNPGNFDYGTWLEKRRAAFLEATVKQTYFWYSVSVTAGMLLMTAAYAKLHLDHRRSMRITAEMMADVYNHDLLSRQAAGQAIERYNRHIEQCNREIEGSEAGDARPGWGDARVDSLRAELQRVARHLEATTQERNKLQEELRQKSLIVADLSTRLDAFAKKASGPRDTVGGAGEQMPTGLHADSTRFVGQINRLQEELYAERRKNRRLKGA